jgi:predicted O-methyltransferase YrrM
MSTTDKSLSLNSPWSIGEEKYGQIHKILSSQRVERVIEFGSGISTIRLSLDFPKAKITSIEHDKDFYGETLKLLAQHQIKNTRVLHCPLKHVRIGLRSYLTYDLDVNLLEGDIDFTLIDGPVESQTLRGREAPLYMIFPLLRIGGLVALDDYHRNSAKAVVKNWLSSYPGNIQVFRDYINFIVLQKCGEQQRPGYLGLRVMLDNWSTNLKLVLRHIRTRLGGFWEKLVNGGR